MNKKKPIMIEISEEQHKNLVNYAIANGSNKTDVIRYLCDALKDLDFKDTNIIIHDNNNIKMISIVKTLKNDKQGLMLVDSKEREDIKNIESVIIYEAGKPLVTSCTIKREETNLPGGGMKWLKE